MFGYLTVIVVHEMHGQIHHNYCTSGKKMILKELHTATHNYCTIYHAYPKLNDHLQVVIKLVILCECSVREILHFVSVSLHLLLLSSDYQSFEERQQTLNNNTTYLITSMGEVVERVREGGERGEGEGGGERGEGGGRERSRGRGREER